MDYYDVQQICLNGHQINSSVRRSPEENKKFCNFCGEKTITKCPECQIEIRGYHHMDGIVVFGETPVPSHCEGCGKPFPWAKRVSKLPNKIDNMENKNEEKNRIFVVHGHDELSKTNVARFIEALGFEAIILHEKSSSGRTIIEKIEHYTDVGFAVVIYTPDDYGNLKSDKVNLHPRARQNVVFEHGYLMGKLGRKNVCALLKENVETPNDISGVVYIELDKKNGWHFDLAKELKSSGYCVDLNKVI